MARSRETKIELTAYDDLFQTDESREEAKLSKIRDIPISEIDEFPDHPFKVLMDEDMEQLVESIKRKRIEEGLVTPTLSATPGDLSLVLPKRIMDGIIEMIYALDKVAPGTANDDTLLYGVEVKFYNMEVEIDKNLESCHKGLYVIGDGSGVTHSLSHASASGVYVARHIISEEE